MIERAKSNPKIKFLCNARILHWDGVDGVLSGFTYETTTPDGIKTNSSVSCDGAFIAIGSMSLSYDFSIHSIRKYMLLSYYRTSTEYSFPGWSDTVRRRWVHRAANQHHDQCAGCVCMWRCG